MSHLFVWDKIVLNFKENAGIDIGDLLFYQSQLISIDDNLCIVQIDELAYNILKDENSPHFTLIKSLIRKHYNKNVDVMFVTDKNVGTTKNVTVSTNAHDYKKTCLSTTHTFDNYFYSYDNTQTIRACTQVITEITTGVNPLSFNPLFIYGESGIGKTHIATALGNELFKKDPSLKILYKNATSFLNEYTDIFKGSLDTTRLDTFKEIYHSLDVLIIDDIQMLRTKNGSLNEFFSIFENMRLNNKTVIITSDVNPKHLGFEERLLTRFLSGLVIKMNFPDSDTKTQIFKANASKINLNIEEAAIQVFIESSKNVRELLGYINSINIDLITFGSTDNMFTKDQAIKIVTRATGANVKITKDDVINTICTYFEVSKADILQKSRKQVHVIPRNFCIYFLKELLDLTYIEISKIFNMRDHTNCVKIVGDFDNFKKSNIVAYDDLRIKFNNM